MSKDLRPLALLHIPCVSIQNAFQKRKKCTISGKKYFFSLTSIHTA